MCPAEMPAAGGVTIVTGAAGFAGSHLLDLLAANHVPTIGWHRPGGHPPADVAGVDWEGVDLLDRQAVRRAIRAAKPVVVYHCAGAAHVGDSWGTTVATLRVNVLGTHHLIQALREEAPGARVLVTSSALVYHPTSSPIDESHPLAPVSPYGLSKLAQELAAGPESDDLAVYLVRPFNHFGPRQAPSFSSAAFARQIAQIEAGQQPPEIAVGNLDARRDLTDVRDTVRAYRDIIEHGRPDRPYNVCSGTATSVQRVLDTLVGLSRTPVRVVTDPSKYRPNDLPILVGDPSRIRRELGWSPRIPFEQTARDLLDYWRRRIASS